MSWQEVIAIEVGMAAAFGAVGLFIVWRMTRRIK